MKLFLDPEYLRDLIEPYGIYAALVLITLLLVNNILWVIPGHGLGVSCGLIFGPLWGTVVCFIGTSLSTVLAVMISKRYGRPFAKEIVGEKQFKKYEEISAAGDIYPFIILTLVPVVPDDALVYLAGLTDMSKTKIIISLCLARLPGIIALVAVGEGIASSNSTLLTVSSGLIAATVVLSVWKKAEIEKFSKGENSLW